jgi:pyrimidine-specific ribonucleoside hydrolase
MAMVLAFCGGMVSGACASSGAGSPTLAPTPSAVPSAAQTASPVATRGAPTTAGGKASRAVVIDTDMAPDDWLAILYLLDRPEVTVRAITVTGAGEAHCEPGVRHALDLVAMAGQPDIPVACGRDTPMSGTHAFPDEWRDSVDSLLGLSLPGNPNEPAPGTAVELLDTTLRSSVDRVTLLALGPLTNVAEALQMSPELADKIEATYVMGGAVDVDGNVGVSGVGIENQFAEWNIYVDPAAAKAVLEAGVRITLVPLDATNDVPVSPEFADRLAADSGTPEAKFASDLLTERRDSIAAGFYYFWDPLAAAVLVDESLSSFESTSLTVVAEEGPESGRVIRSAAGPSSRFATSADLAPLEQTLIDTLNGRAGD